MSLRKSQERYSVLNTQVQLVTYEGNKCVEKRYRTHVKTRFSARKLREMILAYISALTKAGIPVPLVRDSFIHGKDIVFLCDQAGKNIFELGLSPTRCGSFLGKIKKMVDLLALAKQANLYFDPHPKNFVFSRNRIAYVDFYPPYSEAFIQERLRVAEAAERSLVEKNFTYFSGPYLASHFCGDFLNMNTKYHVLFRSIYRMAKQLALTDKTLVAFTQEAIAIRKLEDRRLAKGIFLV